MRTSNCLPIRSGTIWDNPVMFPPGRARLAASPAPTGSITAATTMGIVPVACLAACVAGVV